MVLSYNSQEPLTLLEIFLFLMTVIILLEEKKYDNFLFIILKHFPLQLLMKSLATKQEFWDRCRYDKNHDPENFLTGTLQIE